MNKAAQLKVLNIILASCLLVQAVMVFGHDFIPREVFFPTHVWCGRLLIIIGIIHLFYNWGWVKKNILKYGK